MFGNLFGGRKAEARNLFEKARELAANGAHARAADCLREAIRLRPDYAAAYCNLGLAVDELGDGEEALRLLQKAAELDPASADIRTNLRIASARRVPMWHFSMMNDAARNDAYERAIRAAVRPGSLVLDIGTGSGLLAMMAARAGAARVVSCEMVAPVAEAARRILARNGYADRVEVVTSKSTALRIPEDLPAPADVIVSEIVSSDLIGEGLLETYEDARRLAKQDTVFVPSRAWIRGQLVAAPGIDEFVSVKQVSGFDLTEFNRFRPMKVHLSEAPVALDPLGEAFDLFEFDLSTREGFAAERKTLRTRIVQGGRCVGMLQWVRLQLAEGVFYENAPLADRRRAGHWQPAVH